MPSVSPKPLGLRVLLLDDSPIVLESLQGVFGTRGFEVRTTSTVETFFETMECWRPDFIVTDVNMPEMSGDELCRDLKRREEVRDIPVVLLSSLPDEQLAVLAQDCDAAGFVSKRLDAQEIADEVRSIFEDQT